ncbi:MAG: hypothetical protein LBV67_01555 [Streptococcaceae bacterium]|jgi:ABC-type multidrug transport system fused ATPase/permease subunit|nr:hypothetical protein [Streptococcaceae bacterium]
MLRKFSFGDDVERGLFVFPYYLKYLEKFGKWLGSTLPMKVLLAQYLHTLGEIIAQLTCVLSTLLFSYCFKEMRRRKGTAMKKEISVKVLHEILNEVEMGLCDKNRTLGSVTNPTVKKVLSTSQKAAITAGLGGAAVVSASTLATALAAGGATAIGGGASFVTSSLITSAVIGGGSAVGGGMLAGVLAILGGPIGWTVAGVAVLTTIVMSVKKKRKKENEKKALYQEAIAKQNRILKEQAGEIERLKKMHSESEEEKHKMAKYIDALIARIDYLASLLVVTEAIKEACA